MTQHIGYKILASVVCCLLVAMGAVGFYVTKTQEQTVLEQNRDALLNLSDATKQGVTTIMLAGYADIAEDFATNLKEVQGVSDFRILDRFGAEAFKQNATIFDVNERIGEEEFYERDEEQEIIVVSPQAPQFRQALETQQTTLYYETGPEGEPLLTLLTPIANDKDCTRCHGADHEVRGMIKLTSPLQGVYDEIRNTWIFLTIGLTLVTLVVIAVIGFMVRQFSLPILGVADQMQEISSGEGDLTVQLPVKGRDEVAKLSDGFNRFVNKLSDIIGEVAGSAGQLNDLADGVKQISSQTQRSADQLNRDTEQVVTAVASMQVTVTEVSASANSAMEEARNVDQIAEQGRRDVRGSIDSIHTLKQNIDNSGKAINELGDDVEKITEVLGMIQDISSQTNLLALNASIEAARAGEQGRGFAIVADEVRTLSQRTRQATEDIQGHVERLQSSSEQAQRSMGECLKQADETMDSADRSGSSLDSITAAAHQIVEINTAIAQALDESEQATVSINDSIGSISQATSETTEQSQQAYQRSLKLSALVEQLERLVKQFKI